MSVEAAGASGDDELFRRLGALIAVVGTVLKTLAGFLQLLKGRGVHIAHADHPVPLLHPLQRPELFRQGAQNHIAPAVADPGGHPDQYHLPHLFAELKGIGNHVLGLLHGSGLQQGDAGGYRLPAGVKLVGGGVGAGVVAGDDHKSSLHTGLGGAVERVRHAQKAVLLYHA